MITYKLHPFHGYIPVSGETSAPSAPSELDPIFQKSEIDNSELRTLSKKLFGGLDPDRLHPTFEKKIPESAYPYLGKERSQVHEKIQAIVGTCWKIIDHDPNNKHITAIDGLVNASTEPYLASQILARTWKYFNRNKTLHGEAMLARIGPADLQTYLEELPEVQTLRPLTAFEKEGIPRYFRRLDKGDSIEKVIETLQFEVSSLLIPPSSFRRRAVLKYKSVNHHYLDLQYREKKSFLDYVQNRFIR